MISNTVNRTLLSVAGTTYDFEFRIDDDSELLVYGIDADGDSTLLTTGFTISFDSENEEGTVTFNSTPSSYSQILMLRSKAYTQTTDIPIRAGFSEEDLENALDHIVMLIQQIKEITDYCVRLDLTSGSTAPTLPTPVEGNALIWDANGNLVNSDEALVGPTGPTGATGAAGADGVFSEIASQAEAEAGSNNTKGMTPLRVFQAVRALVFPIGSIVTLGVSTNPATLFGFGTWTAITGKVIVGIDAGQTEFDTLDETGGAKTVTTSNHTHTVSNEGWGEGVTAASGRLLAGVTDGGASSSTNGVNTGSGGTEVLNNLQPYIVKYVWQRTA